MLEEHAPEAMTPKEVAQELLDISLGTIQVTLQRLAKDGLIEQSTCGKYCWTAN